MKMQSVQVTLTEFTHPLSGNRLEKFLDLITDNPFGNFDRMALHHNNPHLDYRAYDREEVRRFATENTSADISLLTGDANETQGGMFLSFTKSDKKNFLSFTIREDYLGADHGAAVLLNYVQSAVALMLGFDHGKVTALMHYPAYYRELGLKKVPKCFGMFLGWMHLFRPSAYQHYFSSEDLLQAPTFKVEAWNNDVIMIMNYAEPLAHSTPETKARLSELTTYLRSHSQARAVEMGK